jgi:intein-encoded DNA endonuclease-like protein
MMRKYSINKDFFKKIDSEEKAYWLGFLYADGCISKDFRQIIIELSDIDKTHLEKFLIAVGSNANVNINKRKYARIYIGCKEMALDLAKLGCIPKKSLILKFPSKEQVPQHLVEHFIRGYYDGDGCFVKYVRSKVNSKGELCHYGVYELNILGTYDMMHNFMGLFGFQLNIHPETKVYKIRYQSKAKIKHVLNYMYENATIFLDRKYNLYNEYNDNL